MNPISCSFLGRISYMYAMDVMEDAARDVSAGKEPRLLLLEHEPVITLGRRADMEHVLCTEESLRMEGIDLVETTRGGDVTFHGPGQLVGYPVLPVGRMVRRHVERIFNTLTDLLADCGILAEFDDSNPGLWVENRKIAAVGIEIRHGVSLHGFCLNVRRDHDGFRHIVPCGISHRGIAYWSDFCKAPTVEEAAWAFASRFATACNLRMETR